MWGRSGEREGERGGDRESMGERERERERKREGGGGEGRGEGERSQVGREGGIETSTAGLPTRMHHTFNYTKY